jgi:hypothetical protein
MWKPQTITFVSLLLFGCATPSDLIPSPFASKSDPEWIQKYDESLRKKQSDSVNSHTGGFESKILLWEKLNCMRRVYVGEARAAQKEYIKSGTSIEDAINSVRADPTWITAKNSCSKQQ